MQEKVVVIGLGYVGLPLALLIERKGFLVTGVDIDSKKIDLLNDRTPPFLDTEIEKYLFYAQNISFQNDFSSVAAADIVIICVPTPVYDNHMPNLEPVISATKGVAEFLRPGQLIILESTVNPGVSEKVIQPILESVSGLTSGIDFSLAHCPERINPGDSKWNVENINRVVGCGDAGGLDRAAHFYESIITATVKKMSSLKAAEAVKVVENSFRDINIAFVNELAMSFTKLGINVTEVIDGAATKPFAFMAHYPGCGVGGHCIPVDPYYLIEYAKEFGFEHNFLMLARQINNGMPEFAVSRLEDGLHSLEKNIAGTTVAVLGLSYKPDIDDCRESPSFEIIKSLEAKGALVKTFDPFVLSRSSHQSLEAVLQDTDAVILATCHSAFRTLTPESYIQFGVQVVVDGRNCLDGAVYTQAGIVYRGIGSF